MKNTKTKFVVLGVIVLFLVSFVGLQMIHNHKMQSMERKIIEKRVDSLQAEALHKYQEAVKRRNQKADSIISEINTIRKYQGKPLLNMRLEGKLDKSNPLYDENLALVYDVTYVGACHYDSSKNRFSSAVLFNLYRPDEPIYIDIQHISENKFMGRSEDRRMMFDTWEIVQMLRDDEIHRRDIK